MQLVGLRMFVSLGAWLTLLARRPAWPIVILAPVGDGSLMAGMAILVIFSTNDLWALAAAVVLFLVVVACNRYVGKEIERRLGV